MQANSYCQVYDQTNRFAYMRAKKTLTKSISWGVKKKLNTKTSLEYGVAKSSKIAEL